MTVESRAARARTSAQETVRGQAASSAAFISSTTSNPLAESLFGLDRFSLTTDALLSSRIDASHPCTHTRVNDVHMMMTIDRLRRHGRTHA